MSARSGLAILAALLAGYLGGYLASNANWQTLPADPFSGCMITFMKGQPSTMQGIVEEHCTKTHGRPN